MNLLAFWVFEARGWKTTVERKVQSHLIHSLNSLRLLDQKNNSCKPLKEPPPCLCPAPCLSVHENLSLGGGLSLPLPSPPLVMVMLDLKPKSLSLLSCTPLISIKDYLSGNEL